MSSDDLSHFNKFSKDWVYPNMAKTYDQEIAMTKSRGADVLSYFIQTFITNKHAKILDIGAGTGLLVDTLKKYDYDNFDALDPSSDMLELAKAKNNYRNYFLEGIQNEQKTSLPDETYDAVMCVGAFNLTQTHIMPEGFYEFARVTKKNGYIFAITRHEYVFKEKHESFSRKLDGVINDMVEKKIVEVVVKCVFPEYFITMDGVMIVLKKL